MHMNKEEKRLIIKCPHCGQEYLPAEIFIPSEFMGKPEGIIKEDKGNIEFYSGNNMNLDEEYICDKCGKKFFIQTDISFKTIKENDDFNDEYSVLIYEDRITLDEPK